MKKKNLLYWTYYLPENKLTSTVIPGFFEIGEYKDKYVFLHVREDFKFNVETDPWLKELEYYVYPISKLEEDMLLDEMGENGKRQYSETIKDLKLGDNYKLYSFSITSESTYLLTKFLEQTLEKPIKISLSNLE